ncbi:hypothetical protein SCALIN_C14_0108 [Candidatus Scalindua japonica]|uniref:Fibronectin type-III domain-containing protein n=2 Tax=Candidatus Scalindua japonica TaxID=1284222 RepID=A0A286TY77_9BACT|nr:hypothetical protein SCALIN_C14_0108 [Candidatus Scalindua japonica]
MSAYDSETVSIIDSSSFTTTVEEYGIGRVIGSTDFDGDGKDEIIVHQSSSGDIRVLNGEDLSEIGKWNVGEFFPMKSNTDFLNRFAISDVTGNGKLELIIGSNNGIYALESSSVMPDLPPIQDLRARAKSGKVQILWTPVPGAEHYMIYRKNGNEDYELIKDEHFTDYCAYVDINLTNGVEYCYKVLYVNDKGQKSLVSNETCATPGARRRRRR